MTLLKIIIKAKRKEIIFEMTIIFVVLGHPLLDEIKYFKTDITKIQGIRNINLIGISW